MNTAQIARACHEINRAYCEAIGDHSQPAWESAPKWQKESAMAGVEYALANPKATPASVHESWLEQKRAAGWSYGNVKNPDLKEHPCFVPYNQLPKAQQIKDHLFRAVVNTLENEV